MANFVEEVGALLQELQIKVWIIIVIYNIQQCQVARNLAASCTWVRTELFRVCVDPALTGTGSGLQATCLLTA